MKYIYVSLLQRLHHLLEDKNILQSWNIKYILYKIQGNIQIDKEEINILKHEAISCSIKRQFLYVFLIRHVQCMEHRLIRLWGNFCFLVTGGQ